MDIKYEDVFPSTTEEIGEMDVAVDVVNSNMDQKIIRESIRKILLEKASVKKPDSLVTWLISKGAHIQIEGSVAGEFDIYVMKNNEVLAEIEVVKASLHPSNPKLIQGSHGLHEYEIGNVFGGHVVKWSHAYTDGLGILVYEIALELCSIYSEGLSPDRWEVSDEALFVWLGYMERDDVDWKQLDPQEFPQTETPIDDASAFSSLRAYMGYKLSDREISDWIEDELRLNNASDGTGPSFMNSWYNHDPLSKIYFKKQFPILKRLVINNLIEWDDDSIMKDLNRIF